jgi:hypothetical protein
MRYIFSVAAICGCLGGAQFAFADAPLPEGTWEFNAGGWEGQLILKVAADNKVTGTVYGDRISGSYDPASGRLDFLRLTDPKKPSSVQTHKGYLFVNQVGKSKRYTLAGTVNGVGDSWESGWYAQMFGASRRSIRWSPTS